MNDKASSANLGAVVSVRGSVVDQPVSPLPELALSRPESVRLVLLLMPL